MIFLFKENILGLSRIIVRLLVMKELIPISKCREVIEGSEKYSDKEIEEIRRTLYGLAELALETYSTLEKPRT